MKCDRETSRHCAVPISLFPPFWSLKNPLGLWSVQGQISSILGSQNAGGDLRKMLITLSPALQLSLSVSDVRGCYIAVHFTILPEPPLELKGAAPAGLRRMCSAQLVRLLLGLSFFPQSVQWWKSFSKCTIVSKLPINTALSARGKNGVSAVKICVYPHCIGQFHIGW